MLNNRLKQLEEEYYARKGKYPATTDGREFTVPERNCTLEGEGGDPKADNGAKKGKAPAA